MRRAIVAILAFFAVVVTVPVDATAEPEPRFAPTSSAPRAAAGFVPPALDLAHLQPPQRDPAKDDPLPARYDTRELGIVSPVKNQGGCGACYAFAAAGDVEASVLRDYGVLVDVSENQLKECHFEEQSCQGGNAQILANLLSWQGSVSEACDPYVASDVDCTPGCAHTYAVLNWRWLSGSTPPAVDALKQAIVNHGPISTSVYAGDDQNTTWWNEFSNWSGGTGLYHDGAEANNHAVMLVGWDDDHPHAGGGTGCWIMRNSWGDGWGDPCDHGTEGGYCYIAYGSAGIGLWSSVVTEVMPIYPELDVAGWDEGGWTQSLGYDATSAWGMVRIDAAETTNLHRVEFWTTDATTDVDIHVYDQFSGGSLAGLLASVTNLSFPGAGYQSVALPDPLPLIAGGDYYIAIRFQTAGFGYPIPVDTQGACAANHAWLSYTGSSWTDVGAGYGCEVGIRVRTSPHLVLPIEDDGAPPPADLDEVAFVLESPWPNPFNPATTLSYTLGREAAVTLRVFDLQGRLVRTLVDETVPAGRHHVRWNGRDDGQRPVAAGVYLCRLDDGWRQRLQRLVLVR